MRSMTMLLPAGSVAIALASGCGGDSGATAPPKSEFIAHAGAICERNKARADRVFKREFADLGHRKPTLAESQRMLAAMLPIIRDSGAAIARLVPQWATRTGSTRTSPPTRRPPSRWSRSRTIPSGRAR